MLNLGFDAVKERKDALQHIGFVPHKVREVAIAVILRNISRLAVMCRVQTMPILMGGTSTAFQLTSLGLTANRIFNTSTRTRKREDTMKADRIRVRSEIYLPALMHSSAPCARRHEIRTPVAPVLRRSTP